MPHDEREWLERARNGDAQAFSKLVERYEKPVYNLCYRMLGNPHAAEDAAQEAFLRAFKAMHRFDPKRKFISWQLSIAANYCIDQHRRRKLDKVAIDNVAPADLDPGEPGVEGQLVAQERREDIQDILQELKPEDRAAVVMLYWYDYSYKEIAEELNLTESAVKSRLHRARRALAEAWQDQQAATLVAERRQHESSIA